MKTVTAAEARQFFAVLREVAEGRSVTSRGKGVATFVPGRQAEDRARECAKRRLLCRLEFVVPTGAVRDWIGDDLYESQMMCGDRHQRARTWGGVTVVNPFVAAERHSLPDQVLQS